MDRKPLSSIFKDMQESENRYQEKLQLIKKYQKDLETVSSEREKINKKIKDLEAEDVKCLDMIATEKTELLGYQIENTVLRKQIAKEEVLTTELKEKLDVCDKNEMEAIKNCHKAVTDYWDKYGINGSVIQEKVYIDNENESKMKSMLQEKERLVARFLELKKNEEICDELEEKKIELLKNLDLKHKNRVILEKEIEQIENEILGLKKQLEMRENEKKSTVKNTTRVVLETKVETREVFSVYTEQIIPGADYNSFVDKGLKSNDQRKRRSLTPRSGSLDKWILPKASCKKTKKNVEEESNGWLILPKQEARSDDKMKLDAPGTSGLSVPSNTEGNIAKRDNEILLEIGQNHPGSSGLVVPSNIEKKSNEAMLEIAEKHDINNAPSFIRSFLRELAYCRKISK